MIDISHSEEIYTVSRLNREARNLLEGSFPALWIEGEISGFLAHTSGHWYFSLKDSTAQVRCAMFRTQNRRLKSAVKNGMQVMVRAQVSLYEGRGDYQLLVEHIEEVGEGKLRQEFEALKKRLAEAGLFAEERKKPLPAFPQTIGVVTSPTGAAIRDILIALKRRYAAAPVILYPTLVQGETAADQIVAALATANRRNECDVLILARGGGSLEDLWCFNEEKVAYAIAQSTLPIVTGIGHEIDFTIADFVADLRAATPTAAAELITPDKDELFAMLAYEKKQLLRLMQQKRQNLQQTVDWMQKHLQQQHPKKRLADQMQRLDLYEAALSRLQSKKITDLQTQLQLLHSRLVSTIPTHRINKMHDQLLLQHQILQAALTKALRSKQQLLGAYAAKLDALSPLSTLQRGYSITLHADGKTLLTNARETHVGDKIKIQLAKGRLECTVDDNT